MSANTPKAMRGGIFDVFDYLRFPLIIAVVFIHSPLTATISTGTISGAESSFPYASITFYAISQIIARIAVPLFFFMSGYLFFRNFETWSWALYFSKLKKRIKSLLIPYIIWNLIVIVGFFIVQTFIPILSSGDNTPIRDFSITDFIKTFWMGVNNSGYPINFPLWFMRNLILIIILSPLVYVIIRYTKIIGLFILGFCFIAIQHSPFPPDTISSFFFTAGAYIGLNRINIINIFSKWTTILTIIYVILVCAALISMNSSYSYYIKQISIIIGLPTLLCLIYEGLQSNKLHIHTFLSSSSFFVYAAHGLFIAFVNRGLFYIFRPSSQLALLICYFGQVILTVFPLLGLYYILKRFFPRFTAIITGGR